MTYRNCVESRTKELIFYSQRRLRLEDIRDPNSGMTRRGQKRENTQTRTEDKPKNKRVVLGTKRERIGDT